ncbi:uncharacterized protein KY384_003472 [Bacidia gigantensis]|uniref:uncharacterized protein n=1 Tax=Bacidia gigantensis TaxID=2732470 RepID=UPI001D05A8C1|nr:uncharacterized protein KY384_003472 [Bacidia gigantensis]KAG8531836.1 hypothetical protein KY384_003472 [Bacidia gigantensis]
MGDVKEEVGLTTQSSEMPDGFGKFGSKIFKFIVEDRTFSVHSDFITDLSPTFDEDVNGGMKEAEQGYAAIKDVSAATFERFIEWVYAGYYTASCPVYESEEPNGDDSHDTNDIKSYQTLMQQAETRLTGNHWSEASNIEALKDLALRELHIRLAHFKLFPTRTDDIVSLIQYVYGNTMQASHDKPDPLRQLVMKYVAAELDTLATHKPLLQLAFWLEKDEGVDFLDEVGAIYQQRL